MARYATELFAHFVYSPDLSYHDLMDREEELKEFFNRVLDEHSAEFIHFEALGDALRTQCVFTSYDVDLFHDVCEALTPGVGPDTEARLLFVDKDLHSLHLYTVTHEGWQECAIDVPVAGPIGRALFEPED